MYLALYRAYRPETFKEVLGQEHIVKILKNQIKTDTISHAYLFCGTRGTGKTTVARLLAKGVNCESEERPCGVCESCGTIKDGISIDVIEIDAASNNGVENIRELRESVKYPPATGKKKVYIIDEVHMLSTGAFNALLKTLEEPPEYVIFILATTEPQKLPATILSRCMRLDFRRVSETLLIEAMKNICGQKGIDISGPALRLIAANADGSVRDGFSILDQCISSGDLKITREDVLSLIGTPGEEVFLELANKIKSGNTDEALLIVDRAMADGNDAKQFLKNFLAHYRNLLIAKYIKNPEDILNISVENAERIKEQSALMPLSEITGAIVEISKTAAEAKWSSQPRILLELCIIMLSAPAPVSVPAAAAPAPAKPAPVIEKPVIEKSAVTDDLWGSLFAGEDPLKGRFMMLSDAEIKTISEKEYILAVRSGFARDFVEDNKKLLEELLEKKTGVNKVIKCVIEEKPVEELAAKLENTFGFSVEVEEE